MPRHDLPTFFVYGTLKRGECRERLWPARPRSIETGYVRGALYDLGPYPALTAGRDWIGGEVWQFDPAHGAIVRAALDEIEGYDQPNEPNLYVRRAVKVFDVPRRSQLAFAETYFFADVEALQPEQRMAPKQTVGSGVVSVVWSGTRSR